MLPEAATIYIHAQDSAFTPSRERCAELLQICDAYDAGILAAAPFFNGMEIPAADYDFEVSPERILELIASAPFVDADILNWQLDEILLAIAEQIEELSQEHERLTVAMVTYNFGRHEILSLADRRIVTSNFSIAFTCCTPRTDSHARLISALADDIAFQDLLQHLATLLETEVAFTYGPG